jgi:hypothetical protein
MDSFRIAAVVVGAALTLPSFAQMNEKRIDNREESLEYRIQQGEKSGKINAQEAAALRKQQNHIRDLENKAEADGKVTKEERAQIEAAQDRASKRIATLTKDGNQTAATGTTGATKKAENRSAATGASRRDNREESQENRIKKGETTGQLSAEEAARLRKGQEHVRDLENKAEADGKVTKEERAAIEKAQDQQSKRNRAQRKDSDRSAATGGTTK